jgi:CHASE3 domain sensor protein
MKPLVTGTIILSTLLAATQPCFAATPGQQPPVTAVAAVRYDLSQPITTSAAAVSMSLAASRQTASEASEQTRSKRGLSTTTILVVGGVVVLAVLLAAAVAGAMPTAGPRKGAFD